MNLCSCFECDFFKGLIGQLMEVGKCVMNLPRLHHILKRFLCDCLDSESQIIYTWFPEISLHFFGVVILKLGREVSARVLRCD